MTSPRPESSSSVQSPLSRRQLLTSLRNAAIAVAPLLAAGCAASSTPRVRDSGAATSTGVAVDALATRSSDCAAYGAAAMARPLAPIRIGRRALAANDVDLRVLHCGVCHSDIHQINNDWKNTIYPCVPGHEIVGEVTAVGTAVRNVAPGDKVAVGAIVDSCQRCPQCTTGLEQYCEGPVGATSTYNGPYKPDGTNTFGGYSARVVVDQRYVHKVPAALTDLAAVAPLLCAGITTYSPMRRWNVRQGQKVGIVGMGGLGHMAVKFAKAMGANVTVFSTSPDKEGDARKFGASDFVITKDAEKMQAAKKQFDFVLSTVPMNHDVNAFVDLTKRDGVFVMVGLLVPFALDNSQLAFHRRVVASSIIGGMPETREMLDLCAQHGITATVQPIAMDAINASLPKVQNGKVRYRYVIDVAGSMRSS
jgi:alcohol dehydrogenase (NADP+)